MLAAGAIAVLSFWSLASFKTATIRTFGLFTGFGILSALAIELTFIPAMRALLPAPRRRERDREAAAHPWIEAFLSAAGRMARLRPWWVLGTAVVLVAVCLAAASRIRVDTSLKQNFRKGDAVSVDDTKINGRFAGTNTLVLLVEGETEGALEDPQVIRAIDRVERLLEAQPSVGKASSYVDFVARMHSAMTADRNDVSRLPATRAMVAQYLFLYSLSGAEQMDTLIDPTHRAAKVRFLVHEDSTLRGQELIGIARDFVSRAFPPGITVRYTGTLASTAAATEVMVEGKIRNIAQIGIITFTIAALLLRSVLAGLLVATPLALAVVVNFGVMGFLGIPLDATTSAIAAMAVGIGADYAVYFLFRVREERAMTPTLHQALDRALMTSGKAVLFVSTAIAGGYVMLCLSGFRLHVQLGGLVALAMLTSSASALVLLPAAVSLIEPRFLGRQDDAIPPIVEVRADVGAVDDRPVGVRPEVAADTRG